MAISADLAAKSVQAALAAIEIYNKPNFAFREEAFALLMTNAWEILLKAKWLVDHGEALDSLYEMVKNKDGQLQPKENRSGNPTSRGLTYLAAAMVADKNCGLEVPTQQNLLALVEIRDNAAHLINKDPYIGRRVQEVGTASLRNYLLLIKKWFNLDLSQYDFFLMPISFFHGFEAAEPATYPAQIEKLIAYLDAREAADVGNSSDQHVALRLETYFIKGKHAAAVEFRYTNDPNAPAIAMRQEDILRNYPMTYEALTAKLSERYVDFLANGKYHQIRRRLESEAKFCFARPLNATKPEGAVQRFYNFNIFTETDKYYTLRAKS